MTNETENQDEQPQPWQPDDELLSKYHATVVVQKVGEDEFLVVFPNGELIISASSWNAQTAAKEFKRARSKALGHHGIAERFAGDLPLGLGGHVVGSVVEAVIAQIGRE